MFLQMEINFTLGKNGGYIPSSLGGSVGRQAGSEWVSKWDKKFYNSTTSILKLSLAIWIDPWY